MSMAIPVSENKNARILKRTAGARGTTSIHLGWVLSVRTIIRLRL